MSKIKKRRWIKAVLFDWDLTLAHAHSINTYSERLQALFHSAGLSFSLPAIEAAMQSHQEQFFTASQVGAPQTPQDITDYYRHILHRLGYVNEDDAFFDQLYHAFARLPVTLYDDSLATLQQLQQQRLTLGIITNHSNLIRPVIDRHVGQYIPTEQVIISQDVLMHKPAPAIFQHAARKLQVEPAQCLFVGDNLNVDAIGAVVQGGYGLGLWIDRETNGEKQQLSPGVHCITSLNQVIDFL